MTLQELETFREIVRNQHEALIKSPCAPGQDVLRHCNAIELLAALRTMDNLIIQEKASLVAPPGATGPVLVGV